MSKRTFLGSTMFVVISFVVVSCFGQGSFIRSGDLLQQIQANDAEIRILEDEVTNLKQEVSLLQKDLDERLTIHRGTENDLILNDSLLLERVENLEVRFEEEFELAGDVVIGLTQELWEATGEPR